MDPRDSGSYPVLPCEPDSGANSPRPAWKAPARESGQMPDGLRPRPGQAVRQGTMAPGPPGEPRPVLRNPDCW